MQVTRAERGKTRASKSRLVLVLLLIGLKSGANFANQSQSEVKQNQSNCQITFDTQLKSALILNFCLLLIIVPYSYVFRLQLHVTVLHCSADIVAIL